MVIGPWIMSYSTIHFRVGVPSSFSTEFPYCPTLSMLGVEKFDQSIGGISVGPFRVS
jgi:hypothetical protein